MLYCNGHMQKNEEIVCYHYLLQCIFYGDPSLEVCQFHKIIFFLHSTILLRKISSKQMTFVGNYTYSTVRKLLRANILQEFLLTIATLKKYRH